MSEMERPKPGVVRSVRSFSWLRAGVVLACSLAAWIPILGTIYVVGLTGILVVALVLAAGYGVALVLFPRDD